MEKHPYALSRVKYAFLVGFFTWGSLLLFINVFVLEKLGPNALAGFVWGAFPLLGYSIERRMANHDD